MVVVVWGCRMAQIGVCNFPAKTTSKRKLRWKKGRVEIVRQLLGTITVKRNRNGSGNGRDGAGECDIYIYTTET